MKLLTKEHQESYETANIWYIFKEKIENKYLKDKKPCKVRDHCHYTDKNRGAAHSICNLKYKVSKRIPIVFHNGSNYDYYLIIKELAEEFKKIIDLFSRKYWKIHNLYRFNSERSYKNW